MQRLDPLALPLNQSALIEASAGTGKTYTITTLYLRAVLGLIDGANAMCEDSLSNGSLINGDNVQTLSVDQILVVTFTEAATQELKERIRDRLKEAQKTIMMWWEHYQNAFDDENDVILPLPSISNIDPMVQKVVEKACIKYSNVDASSSHVQKISEHAVLTVYHLIQNAITLIDEAAIFTIHGFCQRILNQFAFETQMGFEQSFDLDNNQFVNQALHDFWRRYATCLVDEEFQLFESFWKNPSTLQKELAPLLDKQVTITPVIDEREYRSRLKNYKVAIKGLWEALRSSDFIEVVLNSGIKKSVKAFKNIDEISQFAQAPLGEYVLSKETLELYTTHELIDNAKYSAKGKPIDHPITLKFDRAFEQMERAFSPEVRGYWLLLAKQYIEASARSIKHEQQVLTPDDLLIKLSDALGHDTNVLRSAICQKYPLAFIDEFQDTDPIQYTIFHSIYGHDNTLDDESSSNTKRIEADESHLDDQPSMVSFSPTMVMIGDPKQAIYKFRGADINTYIRAKTNLDESQHYTLAKNYRSDPRLIHSVNHLFSQSKNEFESEQIPFIPVDAGRESDRTLVCLNKPEQVAPVLLVNHITPNQEEGDDLVGLAFSETALTLARQTALDIKKMLLPAEQSSYVFKSAGNQTKPIQGKDIAVLVRNRNQAAMVKKSLAALNVKSVYLSQDNVFDSELARDLVRVLEAINLPSSDKKIKAATATLFFGYAPEELLSIQANEQIWYRHIVAFFNANEHWQEGNVTAALDCILRFANSMMVWQKSDADFERTITDYRHLVQLLQAQSAVLAGHEKLLIWARNAINENDKNEALTLRLESDSDLVKIVTMHSSKGLEYPIVFVPFVTEFKKEANALYYSAEDEKLCYRVDKRDSELQKAEKERLAEDIRLLYVALTRAKYQLHLGLFNRIDKKGMNKSSVFLSAFGRLVLGDNLDSLSDIEWQQAVTDYIQPLIESDHARFNVFNSFDVNNDYAKQLNQANHTTELDGRANNDSSLLATSEFNGKIDNTWSILSFSALAHSETSNHHSSNNDQASKNAEHWLPGVSDEPLADGEVSLLKTSASVMEEDKREDFMMSFRFLFPKGANAGSCLHQMFEHLDFQQPVLNQATVLIDAITKYGLVQSLIEIAKSSGTSEQGFEFNDIDNEINERLSSLSGDDKLAFRSSLNALCSWLQNIIETPMLADTTATPDPNYSAGGAWSLSDLSQEMRLDEMEFYFEVKRLTSIDVRNALQISGFENVHYNNELLSGDGLRGLIKGYIDLTCYVDGKFYVLDYKSNYLGSKQEDYQLEQLKISMSDHNYYLQLLIYSYALHKWLLAKMPNYNYEAHFGGGIYMYLRGAGSNRSGLNDGIFNHRVPLEALEYLDNALLNDKELEGQNGV